MKADPLAPWTRVVPGVAATLTSRDLKRLSEDTPGYELVEGRLVQALPAGARLGDIALALGAAVRAYVLAHRLGRVFAAETGFDVTRPGAPTTVLAPDVAFVRGERLPPADSELWDDFLSVAPDLVAEVASPTQYRPEMGEKARRWLGVGGRLVWVVWPAAQQVDVWLPGAEAPIAILEADAALEGLDVLPGFSLPLAHLFQ
jgi:Uma2 family endonuclease